MHARQAHPLAWTIGDHRGRPEAAPPVLDGQTDRGATARQADKDAGFSSVLTHVAQGLLSNAEQRRLDGWRQAVRPDCVAIRDSPAVRAECLDFESQRLSQAE